MQGDLRGVLDHLELRALMLAGEQPAAGEMIHERPGVPTWNVDAFVGASVVVPDDSDAMRRVLARQAEDRREPARPDVLEADEANPGDGMTVMELRTERRRQLTLHDRRVDPEVDQQPSSYRAVDLWKSHDALLLTV